MHHWLGGVVGYSGEGPRNLFTPSFQEGRSTVNIPNCDDLYQGGPVRFPKKEDAGLGRESRNDQLRTVNVLKVSWEQWTKRPHGELTPDP